MSARVTPVASLLGIAILTWSDRMSICGWWPAAWDAPSVESPIRSTNSIAERKLSKMNILAIIQDDMDAHCIIPTG